MASRRLSRSVVAALSFATIAIPFVGVAPAETVEEAALAAALRAKAAMAIEQAGGDKGDQADARQASANETERRLAARMTSAERVNIRIQGYTTLSGEYRINGDGTIAMPGLGRIEVGDATIADFEQRLANEITRVSNRDASVAIEVVEYRPVFVSGIVARAGSFPWKPGLSVLHAETLAGGLNRVIGGSESSLIPSTDRERERAVRAAYELASTLSTIARLKTEKAQGKTFELPKRVASLVAKPEQSAIATAQQATLASRSTAFAMKMSALDNVKNMSLQEKTALESQRTRILDQLSKRRGNVKKIERMTDQGYARGDRLFEEQVRVSELEERLTTTALAIAKMEMSAATAQQDLDLLVLGRKAEIDTELLSLEQKASQLEIEIDSANGLYRKFTGQDALVSRDAELSPSYEIVRVAGSKSQLIRAERATALQPGDVLIVSLSKKSS